MSKQTVFTGAGVALVTPMLPDGKVNESKMRELIDWQIAEGTDAIISCGTTGESSTLTLEEHLTAIRIAIEQTNHRIPLIAGTGSNDTAFAIETCVEAMEMGADAVLVVTPYYNKTSQRGLMAHYRAVAESIPHTPIILYNVPSRTGVNIQPETVAAMYREIPNVVGLKQANGDLSSIAKIASLCDIDIYSGNDNEIVPTLSLGGKGVISVLSNVIPKETHEICARWFAGDPAGSCKLQLDWLDLANGLFTDVNPIPVKEALNLMGWNVGDCRLPLYPMEDAARDKLAAILRAHGLIG
ncbi:MAG: 4-hydroxy-tetrahydrodipicolinate synthase [Clostridia bacterium]|nr:4-hydroxy-tetrahydrodipicolinate synthase [Clostridia bacterium]